MAKLMAPNIRIDWYPEGHFANTQYPQPDELNSGYNLSPAIVTGFTLDSTDTNTVNVTNIFNNHSSEMFTHKSYEGNLQFFLAPRRSNAANEEAFRTAERLFYAGGPKTGYLVKRFGYKWNVPYSAEHRVDLFYVQSTTPKVVTEENSPILLDVTYLPLGLAMSSAHGTPPPEEELPPLPHILPSGNILRNGDFDYGLNNWEFFDLGSTIGTTTAGNDQLWGGLGGHMIHGELTPENSYWGGLYQQVSMYVPAGVYVGYSGYIATEDDDALADIYIDVGSDFDYILDISAPSPMGHFYFGAFRLYHDAMLVEMDLAFHSSGTSSRFWADKLMITLGDTEEEAIEKAATYKPHEDEL